jgi:hypothetical protein
MQITAKFTTVVTIGFQFAVGRNQNPAAHGGVCHIQLRRGAKGVVARRVNTNGRHREVGETFTPSEQQLSQWGSMVRLRERLDSRCRMAR